jgi:hypothetical protein
MAKLSVAFGKRVPLGKIPEIYFEARYEDEIPHDTSREDFYQRCWEIVENEVERKITEQADKSRPRCEKCGKAVESLFSTWDEEAREYLQLCYEDYEATEKKGTQENFAGKSHSMAKPT